MLLEASPVQQHSTADAKIRLFRSLFRGRDDVPYSVRSCGSSARRIPRSPLKNCLTRVVVRPVLPSLILGDMPRSYCRTRPDEETAFCRRSTSALRIERPRSTASSFGLEVQNSTERTVGSWNSESAISAFSRRRLGGLI